MNKKLAPKGKKASGKVTFDATGINLTSQAGLVPASKFLDQQRFSRMINDCTAVQRGDNASYQFNDIIEYCVLGIIGGGRSLDGIGEIWKDHPLRKMLGWASVPGRTTISRLLESLTFEDVVGMENVVHAMRNKIWEESFLPNRNSSDPIIIDVDSTVKTSYGNQKGSEKGFNSSKKGAFSFHPQLAFCAETKEILQGWYRCGSAYTSNGIVPFMAQLHAQLPSNEKFYFRADSGYFSGELLSFLEENDYEYLVKVKMRNLTTLLENQDWSDIENHKGWEESAFEYGCANWNKKRTFKAVRVEIPEENPEDTLLTVRKYSYFCYVTTDSHLTSWEVHKKYGKRATCETWIEESKNQVALANIKINSFEGSSILFQCSVIAYNVFRYMGLVSGNAQLQKWEPATIRTYLIRTAGKLLTGSRGLKLITPINHFHQYEWNDWIKAGGLMKAG